MENTPTTPTTPTNQTNQTNQTISKINTDDTTIQLPSPPSLSRVGRTSGFFSSRPTVYFLWVGDRSGSMYALETAHKQALRDLIKEQQKETETHDVKIGILLFNNTFKFCCEPAFQDINTIDLNFSDTQFKSTGSTALYDSVMEALNHMIIIQDTNRELLSDDAEDKNKYMIQIMTDGQDNASTTSHQSMNDLIESCQTKRGFLINFLATNQCAETSGTQMKIPQTRCMNFDSTPESITQAVRHISRNVTEVADRGATGEFSQEVRNMMSAHRTSKPNGSDSLKRFHTAPPCPLTQTDFMDDSYLSEPPMPTRLTRHLTER